MAGWKRLRNGELHNLYASPSVIKVIKAMRMRLAGHVARKGGMRSSDKIMELRPKEKISLGSIALDGKIISE
jgi:hypothetical protein